MGPRPPTGRLHRPRRHTPLRPPARACEQIKEIEDVVRHSQSYSSTLQSYNTSLQHDLKEEKARRDEVRCAGRQAC
jgi:hypothetical protein